jgi:hypothetical protein
MNVPPMTMNSTLSTLWPSCFSWSTLQRVRESYNLYTQLKNYINSLFPSHFSLQACFIFAYVFDYSRTIIEKKKNLQFGVNQLILFKDESFKGKTETHNINKQNPKYQN